MSNNSDTPRDPAHFVSGNNGKKDTRAPLRAPRALPASKAREVPPAFEAAATTVEASIDSAPRLGPRWPLRLLGWAAALLATLAATLVIDSMLRAAFARADWFGWLAAIIVALGALGALALLLRELAGIWRLRRVTRLRARAEALPGRPDEAGAAAVQRALERLYAHRADMRWALRGLKEQRDSVLAPEERLQLLELQLMQPLDARARRIILRAARDVAGLTAIVPMAALDVLIVAARNLRMLRQLAALYGGRPGWLGGWRLARMVLGHLALTGAMALTDALLPDLLGKGLAGRLSARFGEGLVNGVLTARIGIAALDFVRPLPFAAVERPRLRDIAASLIRPQPEERDSR